MLINCIVPYRGTSEMPTGTKALNRTLINGNYACYSFFQTTVFSITKCQDFNVSGQWEVVTLHEGKQELAIFDAVMVCTGFLTNPHLPLGCFPGTRFSAIDFKLSPWSHPNT